jgi:hypothetical protein
MEQEATVGHKLAALSGYWQRHCKAFSLWFLALPGDKQRTMLLEQAPDMPLLSAATRERNGEVLTATDVILQELCQEGLVAGNGKCLILFLTRQLAQTEKMMAVDLSMLIEMHQQQRMPLFSSGRFDSMDTPFVDPRDPEERVRCISAGCSPETALQVRAGISRGDIVDADVWLTLKIRRAALCNFMWSLCLAHQGASPKGAKPSPSLGALLQSELEAAKESEKLAVAAATAAAADAAAEQSQQSQASISR